VQVKLKMESLALVHLPRINFKLWILGMELLVLKKIASMSSAITIEVRDLICAVNHM
jgi:hypothetical protein